MSLLMPSHSISPDMKFSTLRDLNRLDDRILMKTTASAMPEGHKRRLTELQYGAAFKPPGPASCHMPQAPPVLPGHKPP